MKVMLRYIIQIFLLVIQQFCCTYSRVSMALCRSFRLRFLQLTIFAFSRAHDTSLS